MVGKRRSIWNWLRRRPIAASVWSVLFLMVCGMWIYGYYRTGLGSVGYARATSTPEVQAILLFMENADGAMHFAGMSILSESQKADGFFIYWKSYDSNGLSPGVMHWDTGGPSWRWGQFAVYRNSPYIPYLGAGLLIPTWFPALITAASSLWCWRRWLIRRRPPAGHCPACGYDLRASRDTCPECGRAIEALQSASIRAGLCEPGLEGRVRRHGR